MSTDSWLLDDVVENGWEVIFIFCFEVNGLLRVSSAGVKSNCWITKLVANCISKTLEMKPKPAGITIVLSIFVWFVRVGAHHTLGFNPLENQIWEFIRGGSGILSSYIRKNDPQLSMIMLEGSQHSFDLNLSSVGARSFGFL